MSNDGLLPEWVLELFWRESEPRPGETYDEALKRLEHLRVEPETYYQTYYGASDEK